MDRESGMAGMGNQRQSLPGLLRRCAGIVLAGFGVGLGIGALMSGGEAAVDNNDALGLDLPVLPVVVTVQPAVPLLFIPGGTVTATPVRPATSSYTVQPGDSLTIIAARFGVTVQALITANQITQPSVLNVGQVLIIPSP
jgi:hypothetical protein